MSEEETTFIEDIDDMLVKNRVACDALKMGIDNSTDAEELRVFGNVAVMMFEATSEVLGNAAEALRQHREKGC